MKIWSILNNGHERYVVEGAGLLLENSLQTELAVLVDGTKAEKQQFREDFLSRKFEGLDYGVTPLKNYPGADILLAHTADWTIHAEPDHHDGSNAFYLGENKMRKLLLQGFEPYSQSTVHMHEGEDIQQLKELFWSLHGSLYNLVEDKLHVLHQDFRAHFDVEGKNNLYFDGKIYEPGEAFPLDYNSRPLQVFANQKHQAGTAGDYSLALLWMDRFMEHDPCESDISLSELIKCNKL